MGLMFVSYSDFEIYFRITDFFTQIFSIRYKAINNYMRGGVRGSPSSIRTQKRFFIMVKY